MYGIENIGGGGASTSGKESLQEWRRSSPRIEEPDFVGFKEDTKILEARLLEQKKRRCVISIVGMGGLGKTTLTKKLYNSSIVRNNFNCHVWVNVSQEYRVKDLLLDIGKKVGLNEKKLKEMNKEELEEKIFDILTTRRYLVVIDDNWKTITWDELQTALPDGMEGSKIILTTRNRDVAIHADARSPIHELGFLYEKESWDLFLKKVFPKEEDDLTSCPSELENLGRQIVAKCGGLPLAVVVMGGLLLKKQKTVRAWLMVLQSMNWQLGQDENRCLKILALSYKDLPDYLKPCFLYFGLFPVDSEINTSKLINLWVAEGFVKPRGQETLEDAAEECFDDLIHRSLIQAVTRRYDGRVKSCRIHDLLRDLSMSKAKESNFLDINEKIGLEFSSRARRLASCGKISSNHCDPHLRTFFCFELIPTVELRKLCKVFKYLVILDLQGLRESKLPDGIDGLTNLKYLGLGNATKLTLPFSIANLINLQTLDARSTIITMYNVIWKMKQLRHLYLGRHSQIISLQEDIPVSTMETHSLQSLSGTSENILRWDPFRHLNNLRKLKVFGNYIELGQFATLPKNLESLWVHSERHVNKGLVLSSNLLLCKLCLKGRLEKLPDPHDFPPHLTKLTLAYSQLDEDPLPTLNKLPNLRILVLSDDSYMGKKMVCSEGGFPRLEELELLGIRHMEELEVGGGGMPRIERLTIHACLQLKMVPDGLKKMTTLKQLDINMPTKFHSRLDIHKGEDWDKIKHIPSVIKTMCKSKPRLERIPTGFVRNEQPTW